MDSLEMRKELSKVKGLGSVTVNRIIEHFVKKGLIFSSPQYAYSIDDYYYNGCFDSIEEALEEAKREYKNIDEVYIGTVTRPKLRWNANEERILESMQDNLDEDCGEFADGFLDGISTEQEIELAHMIDKAVEEWLEKYQIKPTCYTVNDGALYPLNNDLAQ